MPVFSSAASGSIIAHNVSQQAKAAAPTCTYWRFTNVARSSALQGDAEQTMWLGFNENAKEGKGSLPVLPGESIDSDSMPDELKQAAVNVICPTVGLQYTLLKVE